MTTWKFYQAGPLTHFLVNWKGGGGVDIMLSNMLRTYRGTDFHIKCHAII